MPQPRGGIEISDQGLGVPRGYPAWLPTVTMVSIKSKMMATTLFSRCAGVLAAAARCLRPKHMYRTSS